MKYYNLQLLRFIAASAVIFFHKLRFGNVTIDFFITKGDYAVSLFFILSGFVIANSLISKHNSFDNYLLRRGLKIYPQWLLSLFVGSFVKGWFTTSVLRIFLGIVLLQSVYPPFSMDLNFVGWSLSVEILMYLIVFFVISKFDIQKLYFDIVVWAVWVITQVTFLYLQTGKPGFVGSMPNFDFFLYYNPIWHINVFLLGIMCCKYLPFFQQLNWLTRIKYPATILSILFISILAVSFMAGYKIGIPRFYHNGFLAPLTGLYIVLLAVIEKNNRTASPTKSEVIKNKLFDISGGISFGMYLFHMPIFYLLNPYLNLEKNGLSFLLYYFIVIFFSYFSYLILDDRLHKLVFKRTKK